MIFTLARSVPHRLVGLFIRRFGSGDADGDVRFFSRKSSFGMNFPGPRGRVFFIGV